MERITVIAIVTLFVAAGASVAANNPQAKVAVHVKDHNSKQSCDVLPPIEGCDDIVTAYTGFSFDAFPVFFDLVAYQGMEYGLCWPDWTYSAAWTQCADLVIGGIVWPGDGISQTWLSCRAEAVAITGWAWIYADGPGLVSVCGHPVTGEIQVLDCEGHVDQAVASFAAGVFGAEGEDACAPVMIEATTWGAIKGMFE